MSTPTKCTHCSDLGYIQDAGFAVCNYCNKDNTINTKCHHCEAQDDENCADYHTRAGMRLESGRYRNIECFKQEIAIAKKEADTLRNQLSEANNLLTGCSKHGKWNGYACVGCLEEENTMLRNHLLVAILQLEYPNNKYPTGSTTGVLSQIKYSTTNKILVDNTEALE